MSDTNFVIEPKDRDGGSATAFAETNDSYGSTGMSVRDVLAGRFSAVMLEHVYATQRQEQHKHDKGSPSEKQFDAVMVKMIAGIPADSFGLAQLMVNEGIVRDEQDRQDQNDCIIRTAEAARKAKAAAEKEQQEGR